MNSLGFRKTFGEIAISNGFDNAFNGWFKVNAETIIVLNLQKSNYTNSFYLNIKICIQGIFGKSYSIDKQLISKDVGNIFRRQPSEYNDVFNLEIPMIDSQRIDILEHLFIDFVIPFTNKASTKLGLLELSNSGQVFILPAVKMEIEIN